MAISYVPLVLRSNFSLLIGTASLENLVARAGQMGLTHLALTDRNNLYGAVPFYKLCRQAGIVPLIGAEVVAPGGRGVLVARNRTGYSNLCAVLTRRNLDPDFSLSETLINLQDGLYILSEDLALIDQLAGRVDPRYLRPWLAQPGRSEPHCQALCRKAHNLKLQLVACPDIFFLDREDYDLHKALRAIGENTVISRLESDVGWAFRSPPSSEAQLDKMVGFGKPTLQNIAHPDSWFMPALAAEKLFGPYCEFSDSTRQIADDCNLELSLGKPIFPKIDLPDGESPRGVLTRLCRDGLARRYRENSDAARSRLDHELTIIDDLGFTDYFLFVWDIMAFAREHGMRTTGRGSGASSLVSYLLGITQADPLKYGLPFERFLHRRRADCPDLDIDVCWIKRDQLIESIYKKYGADRVAMVATHGTFGLRSAVREVAKAHGVSNDLVNQAGHRLPYDSPDTVGEILARTGADRYLPVDPDTLAQIADRAEKIRGFPRHLGIHCGGLVIGDQPLENYVPLQKAAKGIVITQYEKDAIEAIGLVKMDILGNHGLTIQEQAVQLVEANTGGRVDLDTIPDSDPATIGLLREGRTLSCCQLESPAVRNLLCMLQASTIRRVMQALALIRPAPASCGMKEQFIRRARGLDPWTPAHPSLHGVLDETYGIMLYEDDAMLVASALTGMPREAGDLLRRAIAKSGSPEALDDLAREFLVATAANGVPPAVAADLWVQMAKFTSYSFCKAHAASYALLAYQLAYLKAHHPLEFMTAVLNHQWGMYPRRVHLEEAKRLGLGVRGPCVNRSDVEFTIDEGAIRVGLGQVKDLSTRALASILTERQTVPFDSLRDFLSRARTSESEAENLILGGAFDFTGRIRPELILELKTTCSRPQRLGRLTPPRLTDYRPEQKLAFELSVLELVPGAHPMKLWRPAVCRQGGIDSRSLARHVGQVVRTAGIMAARRTATTRANQTMEFVTLEDENGIFEITLFPRVHQKLARCLDGYGPYLVEGKVEDQYGAIMVNAMNIIPFDSAPDSSRISSAVKTEPAAVTGMTTAGRT